MASRLSLIRDFIWGQPEPDVHSEASSTSSMFSSSPRSEFRPESQKRFSLGLLRETGESTAPQSEELTRLFERISLAQSNPEFVEPMPKEVQTECSICLSTLQEPYIVSCCGYRFCKKCINPITPSVSSCPLCKTRFFQKMPDRQLERLLNQRKVYCTLKDEGCTWVGEMEKLQRHLKPSQMLFLPSKDAPALCEYVPIRCTLCKVLYRKQDDHMSVCQMRQVSCDFCEDYRGTFQNRSLHYNVCPMFPVLCPNACDLDTFKRKDLEDHLDKDCPLQDMKCEYQDAGCEVSMLRKDMPKHLESYMKEHLALASAKYRKVTAKYKALKEQTCGSNLKDIQYILITNMSADTNEQHLSSRFGQFGLVLHTRMIPSLNAAVVEFVGKASYGNVLRSSRLCGINLLKQRLRITPIYHGHAAAAFPHQEEEEEREGIFSVPFLRSIK